MYFFYILTFFILETQSVQNLPKDIKRSANASEDFSTENSSGISKIFKLKSAKLFHLNNTIRLPTNNSFTKCSLQVNFSTPGNHSECVNYCRYTDSSLKDCWHGNLKYRTSKVLEKIEDLYGVLLHINHWRHFNEGGDDGGSSGWMGDGGSGSSVDVRNKGGLEGGGERQVKNDDGRRSQGGDNGANNTSSSPSTNTSKGYEKNSVKNVSKSDEQTMMEGVLEERRKEKGMVRKDVMGKIISLIYGEFQHQKHLYEKIHSTQPLFLPSIPCEVFCEYYLHTWMLIALVSFSCNILLVLFIFFSNLRSSTQTFVSL